MNIRLSLVNKIDGRAVLPLATLIHSYIQGHPNVGSIEICPNEIRFTKGIFFTVGRIDYTPYQIECRNGVVYYEGTQAPNAVKDNLFILLVNVLHQLTPGHMAKL